MSKIYIPSEYLNKPCYVINDGYIRVYESIDLEGENTVYDIFVKQDYLVKESKVIYTDDVLCDTLNTYTDDVLYRLDFDKILVCLLILFIFLIYFPLSRILKILKKGSIL